MKFQVKGKEEGYGIELCSRKCRERNARTKETELAGRRQEMGGTQDKLVEVLESWQSMIWPNTKEAGFRRCLRKDKFLNQWAALLDTYPKNMKTLT